MAVQTSFPGVYIDEFAPGAPIQGVGTSTAAFIGPTARGDIDEPEKITSWDGFRTHFGEQPLPGFYLWHAVRGFFENGGQVCYVVRASNGAYGELELENRAAEPAIRLRSREPGAPAVPIEVAVAATHLLAAADTSVFQPTAAIDAIDGRDVTLDDEAGPPPVSAAQVAARFRPGDFITVAGTTLRARVVRVTGATLGLDSELTGAAAGDTLRLADAAPGTRVVRIQHDGPIPTIQSATGTTVSALGAGTILTLEQGGVSDTQIVESVITEHLGGGNTTYRVTFRSGLRAAFEMDPGAPASVQSEEFDVTVTQGSATPYANLGLDPAHPRYFVRMLNGDPAGLVHVELIEPPPPTPPPNDLPADLAATALAGGEDENLADLADADFLRALDALARIDDVNLVAAPDATVELPNLSPANVQQALITHCERLGDRFAVLDAEGGRGLFGADGVTAQRQGLDSTRGYAGLYFPWLHVARPAGGPALLVPPSGHVCGVIARSDLTRGVHKAPANEIIAGALGAEHTMSDIEQGQLNLLGINVIRVFAAGARPLLWGARTTATDLNWQYVSTRRLFLFLEKSIARGIRWAVFEPNNLSLWQKLRRTISAFLMTQWRAGALFGETPADAFYVRIDKQLNPFSEQQLGRLYIEIGVRPAYPAEFIIVRIGIWDGGSEVTET